MSEGLKDCCYPILADLGSWRPRLLIKCIPQVWPKAELHFSLRHLAHPSANFYGTKSANWPQFSTPLAFEPPAFRNGARYLKSKQNQLAPLMPVLSKLGLDTVRPTHPWELFGDKCNTLPP